jgi:hypothetical protein
MVSLKLIFRFGLMLLWGVTTVSFAQEARINIPTINANKPPKIFFCMMNRFINYNKNIESKDKVFVLSIEKKASDYF